MLICLLYLLLQAYGTVQHSILLFGVYGMVCFSLLNVFSKRKQLPIPKFISWLYTSVVVIIGWVLFRASNLSEAVEYLKVMFGIQPSYDVGFSVGYYLNPMVITLLLIACIASMPISKYLRDNVGGFEEQTIFSMVTQNIYIVIILVLCMMFLATSTYNPFIYFRF